MRQQNVQPALEWLDCHREQLTTSRQDFSGFEMRLHSLQFLSILSQQGAIFGSMELQRLLAIRLKRHSLWFRHILSQQGVTFGTIGVAAPFGLQAEAALVMLVRDLEPIATRCGL